MYVTKDFVFIHMNKCAGVFVKDFMKRYLGATTNRYKHAPIRMMENKHRHKTTIGCTRHPYGWYVSFYTYLENNIGFKMGFDEFIKTYTEHSRALLSLGGKGIRRKFENLYPPRTNLPIGAYTYFFINYFSNHARAIFTQWDIKALKRNKEYFLKDIDHLMRVETLREDMIKVFGEKYREAIENFPRKNASVNKPTLTDEHKAIIKERDSILMEYLDYE